MASGGVMYKLPPHYITNPNLEPSNIVYALPKIYKNNLADITNSVPQRNEYNLSEEEMAQLKSVLDQQTSIFKKLSDMRNQLAELSQRLKSGPSDVSQCKQKVKINDKSSDNKKKTDVNTKDAPTFVPTGVVQPICKNGLNIKDLFSNTGNAGLAITIAANPDTPNFAILALIQKLIGKFEHVSLGTYVHSSIAENLREDFRNLLKSKDSPNATVHQLKVSWIWRRDCACATLTLSPGNFTAILGERGICRFLGRFLDLYPRDIFAQPDIARSVDQWFEFAEEFSAVNSRGRREKMLKELNIFLGKAEFLAGKGFSLADVVVWCSLFEFDFVQNPEKLAKNVEKWAKVSNETYGLNEKLKKFHKN